MEVKCRLHSKERAPRQKPTRAWDRKKEPKNYQYDTSPASRIENSLPFVESRNEVSSHHHLLLCVVFLIGFDDTTKNYHRSSN